MPNSDPRDRFVFPIHKLMTDSYSLIDMSKMSLVMRKPAFCICENKDADQLRGSREADQRLCFH